MKKKILFLLVSVVLLSGVFVFANHEKYVDEWNVVLIAKDIKPSGLTLKIKPKREYKNMEISHTGSYKLHYSPHVGLWIQMTEIEFDYKELEYNKMDEYKKGYSYKIDWVKELGYLDKGQYKLTIDFNAYSYDVNNEYTKEKKTFEVEFEI